MVASSFGASGSMVASSLLELVVLWLQALLELVVLWLQALSQMSIRVLTIVKLDKCIIFYFLYKYILFLKTIGKKCVTKNEPQARLSNVWYDRFLKTCLWRKNSLMNMSFLTINYNFFRKKSLWMLS